ncbi:hypothetical protein [Viridibacillus arvi]|uniref:hypothetical protein n=1 Tax=Viridibacillus arvi TaxID=263475 RepID=UPI0034CECBBB
MTFKNIKVPTKLIKIATCAVLISSAALPYYAVDRGIQSVGAETKSLDFNENEWEHLGAGTVSYTTSATLVDFNSEGQICLYNNGDLIKKVDVDFKRYEYMLIANGGVYIYDNVNKTIIMEGERSNYAYLLDPLSDREYGFGSLITTIRTSWTLYRKAKNTAPTTKVTSFNQTPVIDRKMSVTAGGIVTDADKGDKVTLKYAIDKGAERVGHTLIADGTEQPFSLLVIDNEKISAGLHYFEVWSEDDKGNISDKELVSFYAEKTYGPPSIQVKLKNKVLVVSKKEGFNTVTFLGTVKDEDIDDELTIKYELNHGKSKTITTVTADGTDQAFEHSITVDDEYYKGLNYLYVWAEDNQGHTTEKKELYFVLDETAPNINVTNIKDGQLFPGEIIPNIEFSDEYTHYTDIIESIKLDGAEYKKGTPITTVGEHTLEIEATDKVGNMGTKKVAFKINTPPTIVKNIDDQTTQKQKEINIDLSKYFQDAENAPLSFTAFSDNENVVTATVEDSILKLKGMKQGVANIIVQANDGHSDSEVISFATKVDTRPPALSFDNSKLVLLDETAGFDLDGKVEDKDIEDVVVKGNFNNIQKDVTIATTGNKDAWQLHWSASELPLGVYDTLKVTADDGFGGTDSISYPNLIIKVKGIADEYKKALNKYADDISKHVEDVTVNEHGTLLDAYYAIADVKDDATSTNLKDAKTKVDLIAEGDLKTSYLNELTTQAWNFTSQNLSTVDKEILELAGLTNIQTDSLSDYQTKGQQYKNDTMAITLVDEFTKADLQKVIDNVNNVSKALQTKDLADWYALQESALDLVIGHYQSDLLNTIQANVLSYIEKDTTVLTIDVLDKFFAISGETKNEWEYQTYLVDVIKSLKEDLKKSHIVEMVSKVDAINNVLKSGMEEPSKQAISEYLQGVSELVNGNYKDGKESLADSLKLAYLVKYPEQHDKEDFDRLGLEIKEDNIPSYYNKLEQYVDLIGAEHFTVKDAQDIIKAVDASLEAIKSPTDDNIQSMKDSIDGVKDGDKLFHDFMDKLKDAILDIAINNPNELTNDQLKELFGDFIVDDNLNEYQGNLEQYKKDKGKALTQEDIQLVIKATNTVIKAEQEKTLAAVEQAKVIVDKLLEGNLKDALLDRLDKVVIGIITNDTSNMTQEDLEYLGTENIRPELDNDYKHALGNAKAATKSEIQAVVNTVNQLVDSLVDWSHANLSKLAKLKEDLPNGDFKHEIGDYIEVLEDFRIAMNDFEATALDKANTTIEMLPIAPYKTLLNPSQNALNKLLSAKKDLDKASKDGALTAIEEMANNTVKDEMITKWKELHLEYINNRLNEADISALEDLDIKKLNTEYEKDYLDALKQYAEDKGSALTIEDIQLVIDVVNAVNKAKEKKNNELVKEAQTLIKTMIDGELKTSFTKEMSSLYNVLNPSYPVDKDWLEYVQKNSTIVTEADLIKAALKDVNGKYIDDYREALESYTKDKGSLLTKDEIQKIIDAVNALRKALDNKNATDIQNLKEVISSLGDGELKNKYLEKLEALQVSIGYITPSNILEIQKESTVDMQIQFDSSSSNVVIMKVKATPDKVLNNATLTIFAEDKNSKQVLKTIKLGKLKAGKTVVKNYKVLLKDGRNYNVTASLIDDKNKILAKNKINAKDLKKYLFLENVSKEINK